MDDSFKASMALYECKRDKIGADGHNHLLFGLDTLAAGLENIFLEYANDFSTHEVLGNWETWIKAQASLFWRYKKAPDNQPETGMNDDWMRAKRYLGYLLSQHLLSKIEKPSNDMKCPRDMLCSARVKYLLPLNIEEFVRIRAYFIYKARCSANLENDTSHHRDDYFAATNTVYQALGNLLARPGRENTECIDCGTKLAEIHLAGDSLHGSRKQVREARRRDLARLGLDNSVAKLADQCLDSLGWLFGEIEDEAPNQVRLRPVDLLRSHLAVGNMFDFFIMCFLAHGSDEDNTSRRVVADVPVSTRTRRGN